MPKTILLVSILLLSFRREINGHGISGEEEHGDGIELLLYSWDENMNFSLSTTSNNISLDSKFPADMFHISGLDLGNRHADFHKFFPYDLTNTTIKVENMTTLLKFGPDHQEPNMIFRLQYHQDKERQHKKKSTTTEAIVGSLIGVTVTNLCSLFGAICIPIQHRSCYSFILTFMVGLAVAALSNTALWVLLPAALHLNSHEHDDHAIDMATTKMISVFLGVVFLYALEYFLICIPRLYLKQKKVQADNFELDSSRTCDVILDDTMIKLPNSDEISLNDSVTSNEMKKGSTCCSCPSKTTCNAEHFAGIAPVAFMILFGDSLHNFMDGLTIGVAFSSSLSIGITLSLSIMLEELPHEMGDFAILISSGFSVKAALFCNFLSACTAYVGMLIGLSMGKIPSGAEFVLTITAGFFLYISLSDMLPELRDAIKKANEKNQKTLPIFIIQNLGFLTGFLCILALKLIEPYIKI